MNDLPLRKIFIEVDGPSGGPNIYFGDVGVELQICQSLPVVLFRKISIDEDFRNDLESNDDLSSDQSYLRDMILAISSGTVSDSLAKRSPGKLGYARWLTTGNRILRTYLSKTDPSPDFVIMCKYIIRIYARTWFGIKAKPYFYDSPRHIYKMITNTALLNDKRVTDRVHEVISTNAYSLHSKNILCCMLTDDRPDVNSIAVKQILICRKTPENFVRSFIKPKIYFAATDYYYLIDKESTWLESILTKHLSTEYLESLNIYNIKSLTFSKYPSHTQAVERHIQLVSKSSTCLADPIERDGRIHVTLIERQYMPSFKSKKDFKK